MEFKAHDYFVGGESDDLILGYTTRLKGVSSYPEKSFNMALYIDDKDENVHHHQEMLAGELGIPTSRWILPIQKHGSNVAEVSLKDSGVNIKELTDAFYDIDGLYTYDDILLTMNFADCVPVYVFSRKNAFTALAHAGWRGTSKNITQKLIEKYSGNPSDLTVVIGVSINGSAFEVDDTVIDAIDDLHLKNAVKTKENSYMLDLKTVNKNQAALSGVAEENIFVTPLGTEDTDTFFSYRVESGQTGRALAFIGRKAHD